MINLTPKAEKKRIALDFYFRLALLLFLMLDFCLFVALISIVPAYIMSYVKNSSVTAKLEVQKNEPLPSFDQRTLDVINGINDKLALVENAKKNNFSISEKVINAIILSKRPDIKITQIIYENNLDSGKKISITGLAPSREVLLIFRQSLEDNHVFKTVDLPISNFTKGSNIQFALDLTPA